MRRTLLVLAALTFAGCTSVSNFTPWLRRVDTKQIEIIAESGGNHGETWLEQLVDGEWVRVSEVPWTLVFDHGARAIYETRDGYVLTKEAGKNVELECKGELRLRSNEKELVCFYESDAGTQVGVRRFDIEGRQTSDRWSRFQHPPDIGSQKTFVGFDEEGNVLVGSYRHDARLPSRGHSWTNFCELSRIRGADIELLQSVDDGESSCWSDLSWVDRSIHIDRGRRPEG